MADGLTPLARVDADVAIVGSGFAGSLLALALRRRQHRVALVESGRHPRFAIGESTTPLANLLLEELADRYGLPAVRVFSKWGTWQRARPDVGCGLKRGFTFFFHQPHVPFCDGDPRERQLMVAASPHDEIADTHWYRPDLDHALVREAEEAGVVYLDQTRLESVRHTRGMVLEGTRLGTRVQIAARFVIDASGPRGFLHRTLQLGEAPLRWLPPTRGLYSHFEGVARWETVVPPDGEPPYRQDDAALHHVFPGGWIWILRFNNGITSAGAALTEPLALKLRAEEGAPAWDRLMQQLPSVGQQFREAHPTRPFVHASPLAFRSRSAAGSTWALTPSAAGIIDPLLSTGFPLTLLGISRLLDILERTSEGASRQEALQRYAETTLTELDVTEQLVAALYAVMDDVPLFKRLALLYFAAASYAEASRRLDKPELVPDFLLHGHPAFGAELRTCAALAAQAPGGAARALLMDRIDRAVEPFDIAGLLDRSRRDWYPVLAPDLLANAGKLHATIEEVETLLRRSGFPRVSPAPVDPVSQNDGAAGAQDGVQRRTT